MKTIYWLILGLIVISACSTQEEVFIKPTEPVEPTEPIDTSSEDPVTGQGGSSSSGGMSDDTDDFSLDDVKAHNSEDSCYSIIDGKVYDLTEYIPNHKGGSEKILKICGKDGSSTFQDKHGGDTKKENYLSTFYIGILSD